MIESTVRHLIRGRVLHLVRRGELVAVCGAAPQGLRGGWSSPAKGKADCRVCLRRAGYGVGKEAPPRISDNTRAALAEVRSKMSEAYQRAKWLTQISAFTRNADGQTRVFSVRVGSMELQCVAEPIKDRWRATTETLESVASTYEEAAMGLVQTIWRKK